MTEGDALLRAILEEPNDNGLRLIYADWLADHGDEARADFIRRQVRGEESRPIPRSAWPRMAGPWKMDTNSADFYPAGTFLKAAKKTGSWIHYRRGFLDVVGGALQFWLEHGRYFVENHPVESVWLSDKKPGEYRVGTTSASATSYTMTRRFGWYHNEALPNLGHVVPFDIFGHLRGRRVDADEQPSPDGYWTDYSTQKEAAEDLSQALIAWAKSLASVASAS